MATIPPAVRPASLGARLAGLGWRGRLVAAVVAAAALGWLVGDPAARAAGDPELARLLRGMAIVKAMLVAGALRLLWWRFGYAVGPARAWGYVGAVALMATATALAWQLSYLFVLSLAFHAALLTLGLLALRDDRLPAPGRHR
jgi:hypothetical protein